MPVSRKLTLSTGLTYPVLEWDGGGDHTVLLLHGYLDNTWGWQPLVGHSMGGRVAAYYAGAFPERVHRLALLEGLGPPAENEPAAERVAPWLAACRRARAQTPRTYASLDDA